MLRQLIVIVPGIGGSVLADDAGVVWGDRLRRVVGLVREPGRLSLDEAPRLRAVGLMGTLGFCPPFQLHGYDGLVRGLVNGLDAPGLVVDVAADGRDRNLDADIVVMPYDFRLGVEAAARRLAVEVSARLAHVPVSQREKRVIVIGHSMGGLVARLWAGDPEQARTCLAVLTVGTPHRGASKALDWLVNGVRVGANLPVGSSAAQAGSGRLLADLTAVLRGWPGMYDLLPTYRVIADPNRDERLTVADLTGPEAPGFAADAGFAARVARAQELHAAIAAAWSQPERRGPGTIPFFARDHGTAHQARLAGTGALEVLATDPQWQPNPGWRGDGTVPALSAIPPELARPEDSDRWHHVLERHVPMAGTRAVVDVVRSLVGDDVSAVRGGMVEELRLGVDTDDAVWVGEPVTVKARLADRTGPADPDGVTVWVTTQPADGSAPPVQEQAVRDGTGWTYTVTPPGPGLWTVTVQAVHPQGDEPTTVDTVAVLDPDRPAADHRTTGWRES